MHPLSSVLSRCLHATGNLASLLHCSPEPSLLFFFLLIYPSPFSPNPQERIIVRVPYSFAAIVERQSSIKKELHAWKSLPFFRKIISFSKIFFASFSTFLMRGETLLIFEVTRFTDDDDDDGAWNF